MSLKSIILHIDENGDLKVLPGLPRVPVSGLLIDIKITTDGRDLESLTYYYIKTNISLSGAVSSQGLLNTLKLLGPNKEYKGDIFLDTKIGEIINKIPIEERKMLVGNQVDSELALAQLFLTGLACYVTLMNLLAKGVLLKEVPLDFAVPQINILTQGVFKYMQTPFRYALQRLPKGLTKTLMTHSSNFVEFWFSFFESGSNIDSQQMILAILLKLDSDMQLLLKKQERLERLLTG